MSQNSNPERKSKIGLIVEGLCHLLFIITVALLVLALIVYSNSGSFILFVYILFFPALLFFTILGAFAARKSVDFASAFYYQNLSLTIISILGILFLAIFIQSKEGLLQPGPLNFESAMQLILMFIVPCGIGLAISRSYFVKKKINEEEIISSTKFE